MGIEFVFWKPCNLQDSLGYNGFLKAMKFASYKRTAERMASDRLESLTIRIRDSRNSTSMTYPELTETVNHFGSLLPQCKSCLLSSGAENGCYYVLYYPLDEEFERLVFEFFLAEVSILGSICNQIYRDIIKTLPPTPSMWHECRGQDANPCLAIRSTPFEADVFQIDQGRLNSAEVLEALFRTVDTTPEIVVYSLFWQKFSLFAREKASVITSRTLEVAIGVARVYQLAGIQALDSECQVIVLC